MPFRFKPVIGSMDLVRRMVWGLRGMVMAAATLSSWSRSRSFTPWVLRPAARTCMVSMRMILPNWEMAIISVVSSTRLMLVTLTALALVFMLMTPVPPRDWRRLRSTSVRLPKPFSLTVGTCAGFVREEFSKLGGATAAHLNGRFPFAGRPALWEMN